MATIVNIEVVSKYCASLFVWDES